MIVNDPSFVLVKRNWKMIRGERIGRREGREEGEFRLEFIHIYIYRRFGNRAFQRADLVFNIIYRYFKYRVVSCRSMLFSSFLRQNPWTCSLCVLSRNNHHRIWCVSACGDLTNGENPVGIFFFFLSLRRN